MVLGEDRKEVISTMASSITDSISRFITTRLVRLAFSEQSWKFQTSKSGRRLNWTKWINRDGNYHYLKLHPANSPIYSLNILEILQNVIASCKDIIHEHWTSGRTSSQLLRVIFTWFPLNSETEKQYFWNFLLHQDTTNKIVQQSHRSTSNRTPEVVYRSLPCTRLPHDWFLEVLTPNHENGKIRNSKSKRGNPKACTVPVAWKLIPLPGGLYINWLNQIYFNLESGKRKNPDLEPGRTWPQLGGIPSAWDRVLSVLSISIANLFKFEYLK